MSTGHVESANLLECWELEEAAQRCWKALSRKLSAAAGTWGFCRDSWGWGATLEVLQRMSMSEPQMEQVLAGAGWRQRPEGEFPLLCGHDRPIAPWIGLRRR